MGWKLPLCKFGQIFGKPLVTAGRQWLKSVLVVSSRRLMLLLHQIEIVVPLMFKDTKSLFLNNTYKVKSTVGNGAVGLCGSAASTQLSEPTELSFDHAWTEKFCCFGGS